MEFDVDDLLESFLHEGDLDSSGGFTLSEEESLRKLAEFQLPRPGAWILRWVQSACAGGAEELTILPRGNSISFQFKGLDLGTIEQLEGALWNPRPDPNPALQYWKEGLWGGALRQRMPFVVAPAGSQVALAWNGEKLVRKAVKPAQAMTVVLGEPVSGVASLLASDRLSPQLMEELQQSAFASSVPLLLKGKFGDSLRLDGLGLAPHYGFNEVTYPWRFDWLEGPASPLSLSRRSFPKAPLTRRGVYQFLDRLPPFDAAGSGSAALLMSVAVKRSQKGWKALTSGWELSSGKSEVLWIRDGVVIDRLPLPELAVDGWRTAFLVQAEGLPQDLSGFGVLADDAAAERVQISLAQALLQADEIAVSLKSMKLRGNVFAAATGLPVCSLAALFYSGSWNAPMLEWGSALTFLGAGGLSLSIGVYWPRRLESTLRRQLQQLLESWTQAGPKKSRS